MKICILAKGENSQKPKQNFLVSFVFVFQQIAKSQKQKQYFSATDKTTEPCGCVSSPIAFLASTSLSR